MTNTTLIARCARLGWALQPHSDGWELRGNGAPALFGSDVSLAAWLERQEKGREDAPEEIQDMVMQKAMKAPYPFFGGKSGAASLVWERMGRVENVVDAFCGSAAFILAYPHDNAPTITLNDIDGFISNFWRSVSIDPEAVARWLDYPVSEIDLFARHVWLLKQKDALAQRLQVDPDYYDAKIAGWWCWGACAWIGTGWCSGEGPWMVEDGEIVNRQLPHLGNAGQGVNRQLPHLGDAGRGVNRKLPHLGDAGRGVNRKLPHLGDAGRGEHLSAYMMALRDALRGARMACGDWRRVLTASVTTRHGMTAVILDPPYGEGSQEYSAGGNADGQIAADVWAWAVANGADPLLRIAVCAYDDGRALPMGWSKVKWAARKGYQATDEAIKNPDREVIYFSPNCLDMTALPMFAYLESELV